MRIKSVLIAAFLLLQFNSIAQLRNSNFVFQNYNLQLDSFNGFILNSSYQLGSSSLNTAMFSDYLFSDRFDAKNSQAFKESNNAWSRLSSLNANELRYISNKGDDYWEISLDFNNSIYAQMSKPFSQLLLFGNKAFANQTVNSSTNNILDLNYSNLSFKKTGIKTDKWLVQWQAGLVFIYGYANYSANELSIFTEEEGSYLDISINEGRYTEKNAGLDGLGLNLGIEAVRSISDHQKLAIEIKQISPSLLFNKKEYFLDTSFRFDGINLDVEDFESDNFNNLLDSLYEDLLRSKGNNKDFVFLPIDINLSYFHQLVNEDILILKLSSTDFGTYGLSAELNYIHNLNENMQWTSSLSYGVFSQLYFSQQVEILFNNAWHLNAAIHGLNALIIPRSSHFYGASLGIAMDL